MNLEYITSFPNSIISAVDNVKFYKSELNANTVVEAANNKATTISLEIFPLQVIHISLKNSESGNIIN